MLEGTEHMCTLDPAKYRKTSFSNALVYLYAGMYKKLLVNNLPICGSNHLYNIISFFVNYSVPSELLN